MILCAFAVAIGSLTVHRVRADFNRQVADTANQLPSELSIKVDPVNYQIVTIQPPLADFASPSDHAVIRIFTLGGTLVAQEPTQKTHSLGPPVPEPRPPSTATA